MDRSPGFGSTSHNFDALFRLDFSSAPHLLVLNLAMKCNSLDRSTKSTTSHLNVLCLLVNIGFQVLFHSPPGVLFTFPSRYFSTIGHRGVFSLGGWAPLLPTRFLVSRCTLDTTVSTCISCTRLSLSLVMLSNIVLLYSLNHVCSPQPRLYFYIRFGLFRFRSPLLTKSIFLSPPVGT